MGATSSATPRANVSLRVADRLKTASTRCGVQVRPSETPPRRAFRAPPRAPRPRPSRFARPIPSRARAPTGDASPPSLKPSQMAAYGACIQLNMPDVGKGACEREMEALRACVFASKR